MLGLVSFRKYCCPKGLGSNFLSSLCSEIHARPYFMVHWTNISRSLPVSLYLYAGSLFFYSDLAVITHPPPASLFWSLQRANTNNANNVSLHLGDLSESTKPFHINDLKPWEGDGQEGVMTSALPRKKIKDQKDKITCSKSKMISQGNQC